MRQNEYFGVKMVNFWEDLGQNLVAGRGWSPAWAYGRALEAPGRTLRMTLTCHPRVDPSRHYVYFLRAFSGFRFKKSLNFRGN